MIRAETPFDGDAIRRTAADVARHVRTTPVLDVGAELEPAGDGSAGVILKLELLQVTGSFKARGAFAMLIGADVPEAGVVAASGGNFGLALAHAARELGHRARIFVPATSPSEKIDGLASLGAQVEVVDGFYPEALAASERHIASTGAMRAHAYDLPANILGAATLGMELEAQIGLPDTILVAVGGGGLIGGIAAWFTDRARIIAVETAGTACLHAARAAGQPVDVTVSGLAASSLGASRIGSLGWSYHAWIDDSLVVADQDVREAQYRLWELARLVAEPGGATAVAALTSQHYRPAPGERVVAIVCGANTDPATVVRP